MGYKRSKSQVSFVDFVNNLQFGEFVKNNLPLPFESF